MNSLKERMSLHAQRVKQHEEMEALLAGVFTQEAAALREKFATLVAQVIKPAFNEFKATLRTLGRDAVIVTSLSDAPVQGICVTLCDRHLSFGPGKTINLVNPKADILKTPNTKFYNIVMADSVIHISQRTCPHMDPVSTQVPFDDICALFLENELASFFERSYPTPPSGA